MNRKNLTAAVLAGLAGAAGIVGSAQAVNINPDGLGQVLIYPYYTTNGGNQTILSVVNTSASGKAVKVRFLEGQNSQEVLDFNLYLSRYDVWTAAIYDNAGTPTMVTRDTTCTVPYIYAFGNAGLLPGGQQAFLPYELDDGGATDRARAREGHFEMIDMGTLTDTNFFSETAATHVAGVPPVSWIPAISAALGYTAPRVCGQLIDAWTDPDNLVPMDEGYWLTNPLNDLDAPSGGLFGGAGILNASVGALYTYDATAINGFADILTDGGVPPIPLHQVPGNILPGLNSGNIDVGNVFAANGTIVWSTLWRTVDAVSYVFMHDQIMNEYTTEAVVLGASEWVITFPTKQFYVFDEQSGGAGAAVAPFTSHWDHTVTDFSAEACEIVVLDRLWDREEQTPGDDPGAPVPPIVSPAPPSTTPPGIIPFELCFETSVIRFGDVSTIGAATEILGSTNFHNIDKDINGFEYGWARIDMADYPPTDPITGEIIAGPDLVRTLSGQWGYSLDGLPVTGFAVERFHNAFAAGGLLATYGGIYDHKSTRRVNSCWFPVGSPYTCAP